MFICLQGRAKGSVGKDSKETWAGKDPLIFSFRDLGTVSFIHLLHPEGNFDNFSHLRVSLAPQRVRKTTLLPKQLPKHQCKKEWHTPHTAQARIPLPFPFTSGAIRVIKPNFRLFWHHLNKELQIVSASRVSALLHQDIYYPTLQTGNGGTGELQGHTGNVKLIWK